MNVLNVKFEGSANFIINVLMYLQKYLFKGLLASIVTLSYYGNEGGRLYFGLQVGFQSTKLKKEKPNLGNSAKKLKLKKVPPKGTRKNNLHS